MDDSVIYAALKEAIVRAFFQQQTAYDSHGVTTTYGGQISEVVSGILKTDKFKELVESLSDEILKDKKVFENQVKGLFYDKIVEGVGEKLSRDKWSIQEFITACIEAVYKKEIISKIRKDVKLRKRIMSQINIDEFDINVNVIINVIDKKEVTI